MIGGSIGYQIVGPLSGSSVYTQGGPIDGQTIATDVEVNDDSLSFLNIVIATGCTVTVAQNKTWRIQGFLPTTFY